MCFCVRTPSPKHFSLPPSENETFLTLQQRYARHLERTILKLLEPIVGRGHVQATVQIELNLKNAQHQIQSYQPKEDNEIITQKTLEKELFSTLLIYLLIKVI